MTNPSSLARRDHRGLFARLILRASLLSCGAKNVADYGAHQRKNDRRRLVEDFLTRAFGIDEVENRRKYKQCQKPNQNCVRHSDLAGFQFRVGRRSPDDKPGEMITATRGMSPR